MLTKIKDAIENYKNNPDQLRQFLRYLLVGILCFVGEQIIFNIVLFYFLTDQPVYGLTPEQTANVIAASVAFIASFTLNRNWSFESKGNVTKQTVMYLGLFLMNTIISSWGIKKMIELGVHASLAKIILTGLVVSWNFVIYRKIIYRD